MQIDTNRIHVHCLPQEAFDYVADIATHPLWSLDNIRVEKLTAGLVGAGSRFHTVGRSLLMERDLEAEIEVTSFEPPGRFAFVARSGPREFTHVLTFRQDAGGTLIERAMTFEPLPALADRLLAMGKLLDERRDASMAMLKSSTEGGAQQNSSTEAAVKELRNFPATQRGRGGSLAFRFLTDLGRPRHSGGVLHSQDSPQMPAFR